MGTSLTNQTDNLSNIISYAKQILAAETEAIREASHHIDQEFAHAVETLAANQGRVVVSGIGKSGLIGQKISATFASTGTPSFFLHAAEAVHGDFGRITRQDLVLLLSNSGTTDEVVSLAALLKNDSIPIISLTSSSESPLGKLSERVIQFGNLQEACPHDLAPTASTAAMLALGDALALSASKLKAFSEEDFHRTHPKGSLGKLLQPVFDILRFRVGENAAVVGDSVTVKEMLIEADKIPRRCGAVLVVDQQQHLAGIVTDADLRRRLLVDSNILDLTVTELMTKDPVSVDRNTNVRDTIQVIREKRLDEIPVVDENRNPVGVLDVQDLIAMKIIHDDWLSRE